MRMRWWKQWVRQPQALWLRKAVFQVHLWLGLVLGLYVLVLSLTGSALVFRDDLDDLFATPVPAYVEGSKPLERATLTAAAQAAYPDFEIVRMGDRFSQRRPAIEIWFERAAEREERLFSPFTGMDLGDALPAGVRGVLWLASLHDELLLGAEGRFANGIGSLLLTLLCVTGAFVWWPGVQRWRRNLTVRGSASLPRLLWDLHSATGLWFFALLFVWGISGFYLAIPEPFAVVVDALSDPEAFLGERPGDVFLSGLVTLHFGRFESVALKVLWVVLGMVPVVMLVTGVAMWWRRVLRRRLLPTT
jgi:uncharacterized iron-regulated membrane protein